MSHRWDPPGGENWFPLKAFSADLSDQGWTLILRTVSVRENGKLTLPVHELWCSLREDSPDPVFLVNNVRGLEDSDEAPDLSLSDMQEILKDEKWLRSLDPQSSLLLAGTGQFYTTVLLKTKHSIWERDSSNCYVINEKNLLRWLKKGAKEAEQLDDEEDWWCLSHDSPDEESAKKDQVSDYDQGSDGDGDGNEDGKRLSPLKKSSAHATNRDYRDGKYSLILRVVSVNDAGELTYPVRELWCYQLRHDDPDPWYLAYTAYSPDDEDEVEDLTTGDVEEMLLGFLPIPHSCFGGCPNGRCEGFIVGKEPWLRSLDPQSPFMLAGTGQFYTTVLLKTEPSIWYKLDDHRYSIKEENVLLWLHGDRKEADQLDDETGNYCLEPSKDSMEKRGEAGEDQSQMAGVGEAKDPPKLDFTPVDCEAEDLDPGHTADVEKGDASQKR